MASGDGGAATALGELKGTADDGPLFCVKREAGEAPPVLHRTRFPQAQRKIAETSASGVQDKLADGAAILRERRERLEAKRHEQLGEARAHVLEGELRVKR
jgi:hypothetical protein